MRRQAEQRDSVLEGRMGENPPPRVVQSRE
jgi:hypothetical protein